MILGLVEANHIESPKYPHPSHPAALLPSIHLIHHIITMPFFHQNLSPLTRRHGYKIPDFEVDFRPKTASFSTSPSPSNSHSSTLSSPEQQQNSISSSEEEKKKRNRRSKLKPDYFWTAPAPVWKMRNYRIEEAEEGGDVGVAVAVAVAGEGEKEDPFRRSIVEWRDKVEEDSTASSSTSKTYFRMSANRAWEFSSPEIGYCEAEVGEEEDDGRTAMSKT